MPRRSAGIVVAASLAAVAATWWAIGPAESSPQRPSNPIDSPGAESSPPSQAVDRRQAAADTVDPIDRAFAAFAAAIAGGNGPAGARDLRRLLRQDPAALAEASARLLDPGTPTELRRALALVIGTLACDGIDATLLAALETFAADVGMVEALVAALGALRDPPDEDDVFDPIAAPHFAFLGPGGMCITVRNVVADPAAERALCDLLLDRNRARVRAAAADALQFGMEREMTRTRFRTALALETEDAIAARLGESLGLWTRRRTDLDATATVTELLRLADRDGFDEYRLRLETALQECFLDGESRDRLTRLAAVGQPSELREFALATLAGEKPVSAGTRSILLDTLAPGEPDAYLREVAARHLGRLGFDEASRAALDTTWRDLAAGSNVRTAALTALVAMTPIGQRATLLQQAASDADAAVVRCARALGGG